MTIIFILSLILAIFLLILFFGAIFTKFTLVYVCFGPILYLIIRLLSNVSDPFKALIIGFKAAFWPFVATIIINALFFHTIYTCLLINVFGLLIVPFLSAILALFVNFLPMEVIKKFICEIQFNNDEKF